MAQPPWHTPAGQVPPNYNGYGSGYQGSPYGSGSNVAASCQSSHYAPGQSSYSPAGSYGIDPYAPGGYVAPPSQSASSGSYGQAAVYGQASGYAPAAGYAQACPYGQPSGYGIAAGYGAAASYGAGSAYPAVAAAPARDRSRDQHRSRRSRSRRRGAAPAPVSAAAMPVGPSAVDFECLEVGRSLEATISDVVEGVYFYVAENHGRSVWQRRGQVDGLNVLLYFWDDRDGPGSSGWWIGPVVGGDKVWAHHPDSAARLPPDQGWRIPYDGQVDPVFAIKKVPRGQAASGARYELGRSPVDRKTAHGAQAALSSLKTSGGGPPRSSHEEDQRRIMEQRHNQEQWRQVEERRLWLESEERRMNAIRAEEWRRAEAFRLEAERRRWHEQQEQMRRADADRRRQDEERRKFDEKRRAEDIQKEETRASFACRKALQSVLAAAPEVFITIRTDAELVMTKEEKNCGPGYKKIREDFDKALALASKRAEEGIKKKEKDEMVAKLVADFAFLVTATEVKNKSLGEAAKSFEGTQESQDLKMAYGAVQKGVQDMNDALKACTDFALTSKLSDVATSGATQAGTREILVKLLERLRESTFVSSAMDRAAQTAKGSRCRKTAAKHAVQARRKVFHKYDVHGDGAWRMEDIARYAAGEWSFQLATKPLASFYEDLVPPGALGVDWTEFPQVVSFVGIARDADICERKRVARIERAKVEAIEAEELKKLVVVLEAKFQVTFDEISELRVDLERDITVAEERTNHLAEQAESMEEQELTRHVEDADLRAKAINDRVMAARASAEAVPHEDMQGATEVEEFVQTHSRVLIMDMNKFEVRLQRIQTSLGMCRHQLTKREAMARDNLRADVLRVVRRRMIDGDLTPENIFDEIDSSGTGATTTLACVAHIRQMPGGEDLWLANDNDKLCGFFGEPGSKGDANEAGEPGSKVSKEGFAKLLRVFARVANQAVMTTGLNIGESRTLKKLNVGEVIEILDEPQEEETIGVRRLKGRVVRDGVIGWITVAGNQGTVYLEEGGELYRVVKETALMETPADMLEYTSKQVRMLKVGEVVEAVDWEKQEQSKPLDRIKVKAKDDGAVGWASRVDDQAITLLEKL